MIKVYTRTVYSINNINVLSYNRKLPALLNINNTTFKVLKTFRKRKWFTKEIVSYVGVESFDIYNRTTQQVGKYAST